MNKERDKFLTEAMGLCWHKPKAYGGVFQCLECEEFVVMGVGHSNLKPSSWGGFGKLWEWAQQQEWWDEFKTFCNGERFMEFSEEPVPYDWEEYFINPDRFANTLHNFIIENDA